MAEQLKRLDNMILAMEAHGILSYFGMPLEDLKLLAEFIRSKAV